MTIQTTLSQIEEVQAAITRCLEAQSASKGDRYITRALLSALEAREKYLLEKYKREQGQGGPAINIGIPRRTY